MFEKAKADPKVRLLLEKQEKTLRDYTNDLYCAEERGREEGKIETAVNLLAMNLSPDQISKATGLSVEQIESLKNEK